MNSIHITTGFTAWLAVTTSASTAGITLVAEGRPQCTIAIAPEATEQEQLAATELQRYLQKMSGAEVPITTSAEEVTGNRLLIGIYGQAPVATWEGQRPPPDGLAIRTGRRGDAADVYLVGGDAAGALNAVYELLERFLDVRWFMPGELGEEVPSRKTITLPDLDHANFPDYRAIGGLIWAGGPGASDWQRRNKAATGPSGFFFGHNWENILSYRDEKLREEHPDWFALQPDGTRSHQLCSSHPEVIRASIEKARAHFDQNPDAVLFSLSPNDGLGFCTCPRCQALDAQYGVTDGSQTDRFIHYANAVLAGLEKTHPDKLVGILAYVTHTRPPVSAQPHPNYATMICHTPWEFCHVHPINSPDCDRNARFREMIEGWTKVCQHVSVYDYYGHFYIFTPWPILHIIREDLPFLRRIGVENFMSETQQHWANQGLNFYLAAKLAWDTDRDVDALLEDFYTRFYGPAAGPMQRYWERWEEAMQATAEQGCGGYDWLRMFTPELVAECGQLLEEAERSAADAPKVRKRLELHRLGFRFTEAFTRMRHHGARGEWAEALAAGEEAIRIIEESEGTEPQAFWIWLAKSQTEGQMKPYREKLEAASDEP